MRIGVHILGVASPKMCVSVELLVGYVWAFKSHLSLPSFESGQLLRLKTESHHSGMQSAVTRYPSYCIHLASPQILAISDVK